MSFRTIVIKSRCKIEYQLNYLIVRGEEEKRIHLSEIQLIIVETTAVAITAVALCEICKKNIKIVFCDEKYNPCFECMPYYGSFENTKRVKQQINWQQQIKDKLWSKIIFNKIYQQRALLMLQGHKDEADLLFDYMNNIKDADITNREGHAAKVYFNAMFGLGFTRDNKEHHINKMLNYGYSILLSAVNRIIVASGYLTTLGIWHKNDGNDFNLSSDLMEPFRPIIDSLVLRIPETKDFKKVLGNLLNVNVFINSKQTTLSNALTIYLRSCFDTLNTEKINHVIFMETYEL